MITARDRNGRAIFATKDERGVSPEAFCPCCHKRMRARVGDVRRPHWAHESGERCDAWWEEESEWRNNWLEKFAQSGKVDVENILEKDGERHFYDVRFGGRQIAIFRRCKLSSDQIVMRERFFGDMFWFVEGTAHEFERFENQRAEGLIEEIPNKRRCYMFKAKRFCASPFFSRWENCGVPVVYDFASASHEECPLWCVLPGNEGARILLEFPQSDFVHRLKDDGRLLRNDVAEIKGRLWLVQSRAESVDVERITGPMHGGREESRRGFMCSPYGRKGKEQKIGHYLPPEKTYQELVAEYESLGFSRQDAENRARMRRGNC